MKNGPIDGLAAKDIQLQVDKVLRGLGNPEPPVNLLEVRELLKLDLQYYSSVNDGALREMISKMRIGAKQLLMRPSLILDVVQKAQLRALWLPDRRRILVDETIHELKKRHAEAHEIVHSITPHHELFLLGDDRETLCASFHEELEGEANYGASQLLFMQGRFSALARDLPRRFDSVERLSKVFGNTLTMTLWRFVEDTPPDQASFGMITCHPWYVPDNFAAAAPCRYFIESAGFRSQFGSVSEVDAFQAIKSYATRARGGPLGEGEVVFNSRTGERHRFRMETFSNRYEALTLGTHLGPVPASIATF
jgi:hypothetical protein